MLTSEAIEILTRRLGFVSMRLAKKASAGITDRYELAEHGALKVALCALQERRERNAFRHSAPASVSPAIPVTSLQKT